MKTDPFWKRVASVAWTIATTVPSFRDMKPTGDPSVGSHSVSRIPWRWQTSKRSTVSLRISVGKSVSLERYISKRVKKYSHTYSYTVV